MCRWKSKDRYQGLSNRSQSHRGQSDIGTYRGGYSQLKTLLVKILPFPGKNIELDTIQSTIF
jgi:hypothetical protein